MVKAKPVFLEYICQEMKHDFGDGLWCFLLKFFARWHGGKSLHDSNDVYLILLLYPVVG